MNRHEDGGHERRKTAARLFVQWQHTKLLFVIIAVLVGAILVMMSRPYLWAGG